MRFFKIFRFLTIFDNFWIFLDLFGFFCGFTLDFFLKYCFGFKIKKKKHFGFFFSTFMDSLQRLLLKVTKVTTGNLKNCKHIGDPRYKSLKMYMLRKPFFRPNQTLCEHSEHGKKAKQSIVDKSFTFFCPN